MSKLLGILFLISWLTGQIFRLPGKFPITLMDLVMIFLVLYIFFQKETAFNLGKLGILGKLGGILLISWILGLRLFSLPESLPGLLYLLRILGYFLIIIHAKLLFNPIKKWIIPALYLFIFLGLAQYLFLPDTRFLLQYGWDEHYYRLIGTVLDPNYMGAMLGIIILFGGGLRTLELLGILGLILTFSRASWLTTGIGALFLLKGKRQLKKLKTLGTLGFLGILGIYFLAPKPGGEGVNLWRTFSIEQRIESWQEGIAVWQKHPLLGVGFNNYAVFTNKTDHAANAPSNSWILILDTLGILGILGVLGIFGVSSKKIKNISPLWASIAILLSIHAIFNNTLFYPPILGLLALIKAASEEKALL